MRALPGSTFCNPRLGNAKPATLVGRGIHVVHVSLLRPVRGRNCGWPERTDANVGHYGSNLATAVGLVLSPVRFLA